ncbi:uncharacterized protein LOC127871915 [Dreissena polymorpha]|nr:uncharacterized protein LOC127871915 [Dreissena polymorpha]
MIKPVFVIDTVEKQQMFQDDPMIPEHKRNNVFKYNITSFASGLKKTIIQENELLDTLENISGVTVFSEVHDLGFVKLLDYRLCNESGLYEYPINWFLAMPSAIYKNLTLISRGFYKVSFHALHKCTVKKMALTGTHSMHPVLLHVTPNYQLLSQLKVERKFFKVFLNQMGQKTSLILPFVESMVTDSTEVVRPLLDTQYTRVCDVHPTKLLEIFIALTNMPEFEGSMFKQILYKEQWNETKSEDEKSTGREP